MSAIHWIVVDEIDAADAMTSHAPIGYRWACTSSTGLPPGKLRVSFLPESTFVEDRTDGQT